MQPGINAGQCHMQDMASSTWHMAAKAAAQPTTPLGGLGDVLDYTTTVTQILRVKEDLRGFSKSHLAGGYTGIIDKIFLTIQLRLYRRFIC